MFAEEEVLDQSTTAMILGEVASDAILALSKAKASVELTKNDSNSLITATELLENFEKVLDWLETPTASADSRTNALYFEVVVPQWRNRSSDFAKDIERVKNTLNDTLSDSRPSDEKIESAASFFDKILFLSSQRFGEVPLAYENEDIM